MSVQANFQVVGMTCGHCVQAVTDELSRLPGVAGVAVDLAAGNVTVTSAAALDVGEVAAAIDEAGYTLARSA